MDWASFTDLTGYSPAWKFSLTNGGNAIYGMDCNLTGSDYYHQNYYFQDFLDCNILNETLQFFSNGTAPKLNCTSARWVSPNPNDESFRTPHQPRHRKEFNIPPANHFKGVQPGEPVCYPDCYECYDKGPCAHCKSCIGNDTGTCAACFTVKKNMACLDKNKQRCEICWGL